MDIDISEVVYCPSCGIQVDDGHTHLHSAAFLAKIASKNVALRAEVVELTAKLDIAKKFVLNHLHPQLHSSFLATLESR